MNRGLALHGLRRFDEALDAFGRAVALRPDEGDVWSNFSFVLHAQGRLDEASEAAQRALALDPGAAEAWNNLGAALYDLGRHDEALAAFERSVAVRPGFPDALSNKAMLLIRLGDWREGWTLYETRLQRGPPRDLGAPLWTGEAPLAGKRLLVHAEQGLGDTIFMARYASVLADRGARVIVSCPLELGELVASARGVEQVVGPEAPGLQFDLHIATMSLPAAMGARPDTLPADVPYLAAPERSRAKWAARLGPATRRRVGLAWSGNPDHRNDRNRSIPLSLLAPMLGANAEFHALQTDRRADDAAFLRADGRVIDHAADLESFSDTAALAEAMDLVISVDTVAAHLAGALGRPLLIMLPALPDFRWGLEGEATPWYPTARLLRQTARGDWGPVTAAARAALDD